MSPLKNGMIKKIAATLDIKEKYVSIKATTNEGVDDIGKGKAIAAYAAVLLER
jgi:2-C-methyl-D-erythritol 2,4-cyclodiphosphate synthase